MWLVAAYFVGYDPSAGDAADRLVLHEHKEAAPVSVESEAAWFICAVTRSEVARSVYRRQVVDFQPPQWQHLRFWMRSRLLHYLSIDRLFVCSPCGDTAEWQASRSPLPAAVLAQNPHVSGAILIDAGHGRNRRGHQSAMFAELARLRNVSDAKRC